MGVDSSAIVTGRGVATSWSVSLGSQKVLTLVCTCA